MSGMEGLGGMHGWQWLFLVEGLPTVLLGFVLYRMLPDNPGRAPWLNHARAVGPRCRPPRRREGWTSWQARRGADGLKDLRACFVYCAVYTVTFWLPTMIGHRADRHDRLKCRTSSSSAAVRTASKSVAGMLGEP